MPASQHEARVPVLLLTGFLGAGKTSLVNALLRAPALAETAVAVNEFGAVPLDQHLIQGQQGDVLVLANGCLCCNLAGDAEAGILRLFGHRGSLGLPAIRRLIVEPSGLADPGVLAQAILRNPAMAHQMRLSGIVCVVDALFGNRNLADHEEARRQVALADRVVISKADMAGVGQVEATMEAVRHANPMADIVVRMDHSAPEALVPADFIDPERPLSPPASRPRLQAGAPAHPDIRTEALVLAAERPLSWPDLEAWLHRLRISHGRALLRLKGLVAIAGEAAPLLLQGVHHVLHTPTLLDVWPPGQTATHLVLILRGTDPQPIQDSWNALRGA